jgi:peptidoglycan/LPS O-acetylase OafA/YrhL
MLEHRRDGEIPFIHLLRGFAPLPVVWMHLQNQDWPLRDMIMRLLAPFRVNPGEVGVAVFFLISGFIISHVASREDRLTFLVRRVARVWPTLLLAIALMWLVNAVAPKPFSGFSTAQTPVDYLRSALLLDFVTIGHPRALAVTWTLVIEIMFYALVASMIGFLRLSPVGSTLAMIGITALASVAYMQFPSLSQLNGLSTTVLYLIVGRVFYLHWRGTIGGGQTAVLLALSFGLFVVLFSSLPSNLMFVAPYTQLVSYSASALLVFGVMQAGIKTVLAPVRFLADTSYAIYLLHVPIGLTALTIGRDLGLSPGLSFSASVGLVLAVSAGVVRWIEKPAQAFARELLAKRHPPVNAQN